MKKALELAIAPIDSAEMLYKFVESFLPWIENEVNCKFLSGGKSTGLTLIDFN